MPNFVTTPFLSNDFYKKNLVGWRLQNFKTNILIYINFNKFKKSTIHSTIQKVNNYMDFGFLLTKSIKNGSINDLDDWLKFYNTDRTHQGNVCNGRTPFATLLDGKLIWAEKNLAQI